MVSRTVVPSATSVRIIPHSSSRLRGSRPVVGSSRYRNRGRPTRLAARSSRRRIPPEYALTYFVAASDRSKASSSSAARARADDDGRPNSRPSKNRLSCPESSSSTAAYWPVNPISPRPSPAPAHVEAADRGAARVRRRSVDRIRIAVVLPAPLGPRRPKTVPSRATMSTRRAHGPSRRLHQPRLDR